MIFCLWDHFGRQRGLWMITTTVPYGFTWSTQSCWCIKIEIRLSKWPSINFNQDRSWHTRNSILHFLKNTKIPAHATKQVVYWDIQKCIICAAGSQPLAAHIIQLSVSRYTFVYHDIQLYIAIYNEKCFLRNLSQDRSWHTKSQIAHFLPKKQFWADLSHSFSETITATQFKLIHLLGAKPPALRAPGPPDAPNNGDACWKPRATPNPPPATPKTKQAGSNGWINARIANRHANRAKNGKNRHLAKKTLI